MAYETDLLEYEDMFDGGAVLEGRVAALEQSKRRPSWRRSTAMGGVVAAIESGELKRRLVESNARRMEAIERGEQKVVGVNCFTASEPSPLTAGEGAILVPSPKAEAEQIARLAGVAG